MSTSATRGGAAGAAGRRPDQLPAGHHGLSPEEVAASQRARILEAMRASLAEHGYSDASVADVIKRAGVSRKTFYAQFADKEACFLEIYGERMARLQEVVRDAHDAQDEWIPSLRAAVAALLRTLASEPDAARLCFVEVLAAGPRAAEARNAALGELERTLELGRGDGDAGAPASLGRSMAGGLAEVLYQEIVAGRAAELPAMLPELMYALVLPVAGATAAEHELHRAPRREA